MRPINNALRGAESGFRPAGHGSDTHMATRSTPVRRSSPTSGNGKGPIMSSGPMEKS